MCGQRNSGTKHLKNNSWLLVSYAKKETASLENLKAKVSTFLKNSTENDMKRNTNISVIASVAQAHRSTPKRTRIK